MPNACFILDENGTVIYRNNWMNPSHVEILLSGLKLSKEDLPIKGVSVPHNPDFASAYQVLRKAGTKALWNYAKTYPRLLFTEQQLRTKLRDNPLMS